MGVVGFAISVSFLRISDLKPCGKFNGAVGNFNAHVVAFPNKDWPKLAETFVKVRTTLQPFSI